MTTPEQFQEILDSPEGTRIEFKAASGTFHLEELVKYCVALANEGGGTVVLGVTDARPRQVVGTRAFAEPGRTEAGLYERLGHRVRIEEHFAGGQRVLITHVPSRLPGTAWTYEGAFWMRACGFRSNPITRFAPIRSVVSEVSDHPPVRPSAR